jgi:hypothetical protein
MVIYKEITNTEIIKDKRKKGVEELIKAHTYKSSRIISIDESSFNLEKKEMKSRSLINNPGVYYSNLKSKNISFLAAID